MFLLIFKYVFMQRQYNKCHPYACFFKTNYIFYTECVIFAKICSTINWKYDRNINWTIMRLIQDINISISSICGYQKRDLLIAHVFKFKIPLRTMMCCSFVVINQYNWGQPGYLHQHDDDPNNGKQHSIWVTTVKLTQ